ncbi:MAG: signal peptidase I [Clostridia bacterium]|nr:signal peptidase I [Clostridia bacterium]
MKKTEKIKNIICIILIIAILPILFVNLFIVIDSFIHPDEIPSFVGYKPFVVLSGSMETEIYTGDLAIVKVIDTNQLKENDIIAYKSGDFVVVHRIIKKVNENGTTKFVTKGDNNNTEDDEMITLDKIEGKYLFKISKLGNFVMFLQTPIGLLISISIPVLIIVIAQISRNRQYKKELEQLQKTK